MPKLHLTIPAELLDKLDAAKPDFLDRKGFICLLLSEQLTRVRTLPAYCVGAGNPDHLTTETALRLEEAPQGAAAVLPVPPLKKSLSKNQALLEDGVGKGLLGETPRKEPLDGAEGYKSADPAAVSAAVPEARLGKTRQANTKGSPAFEAFWKQYQAIKRRASSQSKPKALVMWEEVLGSGTTAEQLRQALGAAVTKQNQIERDGGYASPFPDCFRWLRDGYYEAFLETPALVVPISQRPDFTPPADHPDAPF